MLTIRVDDTEVFDENTNTFVKRAGFVLELEHSLVSLSKWESLWEKPFLSPKEKTPEEIYSYIECMHLGEPLPKDFSELLNSDHLKAINDLIHAKKTATWFSKEAGKNTPGSSNGTTVTSEILYYWIISYQIPMECERWHLNRLITLIRVCNEKNSKPKKMSRNEVASRYRDLNAQRKAQLNTRG